MDGLFGAAAPAETLSPASPDMPRLGLTMGGQGRPSETIAIDAFYEVMSWLQRESTSLDAPLATYRGRAHVGGLTVSVAIP